jgi:hypothetical protein
MNNPATPKVGVSPKPMVGALNSTFDPEERISVGTLFESGTQMPKPTSVEAAP